MSNSLCQELLSTWCVLTYLIIMTIWDVDAVIIHISLIRKHRHREVKYLAQGHRAFKRQSQDSNSASLAPKSALVHTGIASSHQEIVPETVGLTQGPRIVHLEPFLFLSQQPPPLPVFLSMTSGNAHGYSGGTVNLIIHKHSWRNE